MINKKILAIIIAVFAIFPSGTMLAQSDCPPDRLVNVFEKQSIEKRKDFFSLTLNISAAFQERSSGSNSWEILLDNSSVTIGNKFVSSYTSNKLAMMEIAKSKAVKDVETDVTFAYSTDCKVNLRTALRVDKEQSIYCCENPKIDPKIYEYKGLLLSDYWTTKVCGTKCCQITYKVIINETVEGNIPTVVSVSEPDSYHGSVCNETTQYFDCLTGEPRQCESDCKPAK